MLIKKTAVYNKHDIVNLIKEDLKSYKLAATDNVNFDRWSVEQLK